MADKELKTIKFQMMLSESEAEAIDDWSFKNRIRSRAEAIRRLCQIGMSADEHVPSLVQTMVEAAEHRFDETEKLMSMSDKWLLTSKSKFIDFSFDASKATLKDLEKLLRAAESLNSWFAQVRGADDTDATLANAEKAAKLLREAIEAKKMPEEPES